MRKSIFGVKIGTENINSIINKINIYLKTKNKDSHPYHIVNMNPEIFILAYQDSKFRSIINNADSILIDGIGIKIMSWFYRIKSGQRMTGTDFLNLIVKVAVENKQKVIFLGGKNNVSYLTGAYFKQKYPKLIFLSSNGVNNIKKENLKERRKIIKKVNNFKPRFLFISYGSPYQEYWIEKNKQYLNGIVCFGVGGGFNLISKRAIRAPKTIRRIGLEWLWRFIFEPQRLFRVIPRYIKFITLILFGYLSYKK